MSIILGPFDKTDEPVHDVFDQKELMVFGYQCKLYRDDNKANMENDEELLIPWMGDRSLMVDRYDVRNRFDDKSQFGLKSNLPQRFTEQEEELERLLDEERYKAIDTDITEEDLQREEEQKRLRELMAPKGSYNAVGFGYDNLPEQQQQQQQLSDQPQIKQYLSTTYVDNPEEGGEYERPYKLFIPPNIQMPYSQKLHSVIERTALFISKQGQQMEIIIKTKQRFNPSFSFLHHEDRLFSYYKHLFNCIKNGSYQPQVPQKETHELSGDDTTKVVLSNEEKMTIINGSIIGQDSTNQISDKLVSAKFLADDEDNSSSSDEECELHPILRAKLNRPKEPESCSEPDPHTNDSNLNQSKFKSKTFKNVAYNINSAPNVTEESLTNNGHNPTTTSTAKTESNSDDVIDPINTPGMGVVSVNETEGYTICHHGYDPMMAYYQASQMYHTGAVPPPPDLQPVVDKTAEYVAKNGDQFEATVILKHISDSRFGFLNPWNQFNHYYKTRVSEYRDSVKMAQDNAPKNMQKLNYAGNINFKMSANVVTHIGVNNNMIAMNDKETDSNGGEENGDLPVNKKQKLAEDAAMDTTIKHFLHTVKSSFN